jgi:hypothetical protein
LPAPAAIADRTDAYQTEPMLTGHIHRVAALSRISINNTLEE